MKNEVSDTVVIKLTITDTAVNWVGEAKDIEKLYKAVLGVDDVHVDKLQVFKMDNRKGEKK